MQGFVPARRGHFVSAKGPKTISAQVRPPQGKLCNETKLNGKGTRSAQTTLAKKSNLVSLQSRT